MTTSRPQILPVLALHGVRKGYGKGESRVEVLRGASLEVFAGEAVALVAPSGSGKSTLLHVAGLLEEPDDGLIEIDGDDCRALSDAGRTQRRRDTIGFVYQFHHLLPELTAAENLVMPQLIRGQPRATAHERAHQLLEYVGVAHRAVHRPSEMSGGEQQRVAIARAVANAPRLILADEPTGNLDPKTSDHVFSAMIRLVKTSGLAALIATHNLDLARRMDRAITLDEGRVVPADIGG